MLLSIITSFCKRDPWRIKTTDCSFVPIIFCLFREERSRTLQVLCYRTSCEGWWWGIFRSFELCCTFWWLLRICWPFWDNHLSIHRLSIYSRWAGSPLKNHDWPYQILSSSYKVFLSPQIHRKTWGILKDNCSAKLIEFYQFLCTIKIVQFFVTDS